MRWSTGIGGSRRGVRSERVGELPRDAVGVFSGDVVAGEAGGGVEQVIQGSGAGPGPLVLEVRGGPYDQQPVQQPQPLQRPSDGRVFELAGAAVAAVARVDRGDPFPQDVVGLVGPVGADPEPVGAGGVAEDGANSPPAAGNVRSQRWCRRNGSCSPSKVVRISLSTRKALSAPPAGARRPAARSVGRRPGCHLPGYVVASAPPTVATVAFYITYLKRSSRSGERVDPRAVSPRPAAASVKRSATAGWLRRWPSGVPRSPWSVRPRWRRRGSPP